MFYIVASNTTILIIRLVNKGYILLLLYNDTMNPKYLDNINNKVIDDLCVEIRRGSKISMVAASFSIYAYQALKKELSQVD